MPRKNWIFFILIIFFSSQILFAQGIDFYTPKTVYTMPEVNEILQNIANQVANQTNIEYYSLTDLFLPLQNHIDQNLIAHGKGATLHPSNISDFIVKKVKAGELPTNIGLDLVEEFRRTGFISPEGEQKEWQKVVVSVSKTKERVVETPATVVVINSEEIEQRGYTDLEQILHDLPAFDLSRVNGTVYSFVYQRGYRSNSTDRTLLLIDGVEDNDLWSSILYLSRQYPLSNIESIEVIYGPASTMYGANAFVGVINVITKKPESIIEEGKYFGFNSQMGYGSWNTRYVDMMAAGKYKDFTIGITARVFQSDEMDLSDYSSWDYKPHDVEFYEDKLRVFGTDEDGNYAAEHYLETNDIDPAHPYITTVKNDDGEIVELKLSEAGREKARELDAEALNGEYGGSSIGYSNSTNDWLIHINGKIENLEFGIQSWKRKEGATSWYTDDSRIGTNNGAYWVPRNTFFYLKYSKNFMDKLDFTFLGRYKSHGLDNETNAINLIGYSNQSLEIKDLVAEKESYWESTYSYQLSKQLRAEIKAIYTHSDKMNIILGSEFRNSLLQGDYVKSTEPNPSETGDAVTADGGNYSNQIDVGVYTQGSYRISDDIKLVLGGRIDYNKIRESGGYGTVFNPKAAMVYTPHTFIFKAIYSQAFQDASNWTKYSTAATRLLNNPNLDPEKVSNFEISAGWQATDRLFADVVAYDARYEGVVGTVKVKLADGRITTQNQAIGELHIWGIQARTMLNFKNYSIYANYTYTDPTNTKDEESTEHVRIADIASHQFNAGVNAKLFDRLNANLRMNYVGDRITGKETTVRTNPNDKIDSYMIFNGAVTYKNIYPGVSLQLVANNILDNEYFHPGIRSADGEFYASKVPQNRRNFIFKVITKF